MNLVCAESLRHFLEVYNDLGNALRSAGHLAEAVTCYSYCLQLHSQHIQGSAWPPNLAYSVSITYNNMAGVLKLQGHVDDALACYEYVVRLQPESADAFANLGSEYKDAARLEQAIWAYRRALQLRPAGGGAR